MVRSSLVTHQVISTFEKARDNYEHIISSIPAIAAIVDRDLNIIKGNSHLAELYAVDYEKLYRKNIADIFNSENATVFREMIAQSEIDNNEVSKAIPINTVKNNEQELTVYRWSVECFNPENYNQLFFLIIASDVTEVYTERRKLQQLNKNLENLVAERTDELIQSQQMAVKEALIQGKAEVVHNILHVFGNNLLTLTGFQLNTASQLYSDNNIQTIKDIEMLIYKKNPDEALALTKKLLSDEINFVQNLTLVNEQLSKKITFLTSFLHSLRDIQDVDLKKEDHSPKSLIGEVIEDCRNRLEDNRVKLNINNSFSLDNVYTNETKFKYIIRQLLLNAIDEVSVSCLKGDGKIDIDINENDDGSFRFLISDNGGGINEEHQYSMYQLGISHRNPKQLGLGLHLASSDADSLGGSISLVKTNSSGSTFQFTLKKVKS